MGDRIDRPGLMPDHDGAYEDAPNQQAQAELNGLQRGLAEEERGAEAAKKEHSPGNQDDPQLPEVALEPFVEGLAQEVPRISFVASESVELAVLDHDPAHVRPEEIDQRTVRVGLLVGVLVVPAMDRDPACRGVLQTAESEDGERVLEPFRAAETPVRQQAVIAEVDAENAEDVVAHDEEGHAGPTEEPRHERKQREQMIADQEYGGEPDDAPDAHGGRQRQPPRTQRCRADANRLGSQRHSPLAS